jgi:hypothetical protein
MARRETVRCPTCRREVAWEGNPHRPFCSERCRVLDLGNWATDSYRIPGEEVDPEDVEPGEDNPPDGSERSS